MSSLARSRGPAQEVNVLPQDDGLVRYAQFMVATARVPEARALFASVVNQAQLRHKAAVSQQTLTDGVTSPIAGSRNGSEDR